MWASLATGSWLTRERMRIFAIASAAATLFSLAYLLGTAHGTLDAWGRPLGTDFSNVYAAGRMALDGQASGAWDWGRHYAVQQQLHGDPQVPFYGWHYPPPFLLVASWLALLPYTAALALWQGTTLTGAVLLARRIVPDRRTLFYALAAPITFICLGHGQNGFLTAALLGGGLLLLDRRPFVAGLLLGCLVYKPQFALLIPPLLVVGGHWRAFLGATFSCGALILASLAWWGWPVWEAFLHSLPLTREVVIEAGTTGWGKIQSPFAMTRMWGGGIALSYAVQAFATAGSIGGALWLTRTAGAAQRNAAAAAAALLSTPYVLDYDFVLLGIGAAFLIRDGMQRGFLTWEKSLLAFVWIAPLFARQLATFALLPIGQATAAIVLGLAIRRAIMLDDAATTIVRASPFRRSRAASGR